MLLARLIVVIVSLLLGDTLQAAVGPQCFNCEVYEHSPPPPLPILNQSLLNYTPLEIRVRHAAIPVLAAGAYQLGISLMNHGLPPTPWNHAVFGLGGPLNLQEACQMVVDREALGIQVNFQHPLAIAAIAAGAAPAAAAAIVGMAPALFNAYLNRALGGGGYSTPQAVAIYRLRHNIPQPNFLLLPVGGAAAHANCVIIHFHNVMRVSKNLKELSYNSLVAPAVGYVSIKDMINNQFIALGLPVPSSATVISADALQPD